MNMEELKRDYQRLLEENNLSWWDLTFEDYLESEGK